MSIEGRRGSGDEEKTEHAREASSTTRTLPVATFASRTGRARGQEGPPRVCKRHCCHGRRTRVSGRAILCHATEQWLTASNTLDLTVAILSQMQCQTSSRPRRTSRRPRRTSRPPRRTSRSPPPGPRAARVRPVPRRTSRRPGLPRRMHWTPRLPTFRY